MRCLALAAGAVCLVTAGACGPSETDTARAADAAAQPAVGPTCSITERAITLPAEVGETSGLAPSGFDRRVLWTHNDAGDEPVLYAVDVEGRMVRSVRVEGAEHVDWEDVELGECDGGHCLYLGDIGDNDANRERLTIYRVPEPGADAGATEEAVRLHVQLVEGAADAEALFLAGGDIFLVTTGDHGPVTLHKYPPPQRPGQTVGLERLGTLFPPAERVEDRVTGATATPDGRWVAVRSRGHLYFYWAGALLAGEDVRPTEIDVSDLDAAQGESVAISADGTVWLSSEKGDGSPPVLSRLYCEFPTA